MSGLSAWESASVEAYEEAGIEGEVGSEALGAYRNALNADPEEMVLIVLYPLKVTRQLDNWQEKRTRRRRWVDYDHAVALLDDPGKIRLLDELQHRLAAQDVE